MAVDTGHGASITFGTQGGTYRCLNVGGWTEARGDVPTWYLATTGFKTYVPEDLNEPGEFTLAVQYEGTVGLPTLAATAETITVTHPVQPDESTAAYYAGSGYVKSREYPTLETNVLKVATVIIKWDGVTGPTETKAT